MKKEENITTNPDTNIIEKKAKSSKVKNVSSKTENKEIAVVEEKSKTVKKVPKKHQEKLPKKKLPKMFKKKYSAKGLKKKLLSKIFIAEDKKYVTSLFEETKIGKKEKIVFKIPDDKLFSLVELKRLKVLAKQINKQKGTVKFIPLFLFIIIVVSVFLFTDLILKIGLKSTLQSIFKAKTSIGSVHLDYMESSLSIKNLVVADKEAPMTNLFQFDSIIFDIDINRLLEKSIVIDEIEAAGFAMGTERQTSGELIIKEKVKKEKKPKEPIIKPEFIENAKAKFSTELQKMFGKFDPKVILENTYNSLQTPVVAKRVTEEINTITPYWQEKPKEIGSQVENFIAKANKLSTLDFSNIKDLKKLESNITLITETLNEGEQLSNSFKTTYNKLDSDIKSVTKLSTEIQQAIQADTKLASNITSSIKSFTPQSGMRLVTNSVEDFLNNVLGNVYPLITELITTIQEVKDILPEKEPKEEKPKIQRLKGTNFYWNRPEMPKVYIGKAHASGSGFDVLGNNLSTNPKLINSPMTLDGTYNIANRQDSFNATLDVHNLSSSSLFSASYHAPNVPTNLDFLTSNSDLDVMIAIENDKSVSISGNAILSNTDVKLPTFEPAFAYSICNEAVQQIDNTYFNVLTGFNNAGNMNLNINTDFDNQFMNVVTKLVNKELTTIKNEATVAINQKLEEYSAPIKEKINEFNVYKDKLNSYKRDLENKIAELKAKVEEGKQKAIEYGKQQAESKIEETVNKYVDTDKIDSLKKWF